MTELPEIKRGDTVSYHGSMPDYHNKMFRVMGVSEGEMWEVTDYPVRYTLLPFNARFGDKYLYNVRRESLTLVFDANETEEILKVEAEIND